MLNNYLIPHLGAVKVRKDVASVLKLIAAAGAEEGDFGLARSLTWQPEPRAVLVDSPCALIARLVNRKVPSVT